MLLLRMLMLREAPGIGSYGAISTNHLNVNYRLEGGAESSACIEERRKKERAREREEINIIRRKIMSIYKPLQAV